MKSATILSTLIALAAAQPHAHLHQRAHHVQKRDVVTVYDVQTVYQTVTALVDENGSIEYIRPGPATSSVDGRFIEKKSTFSPGPTSTSSSAPVPTSTSEEVSIVIPTTTPKVEIPLTTLIPVVTPPPVEPTTTEAPAPRPTSTKVSPVTPPVSGGTVGDLTHYTVGLGSCGQDDGGADRSANICAVSYALMGDAKVHCGQTINISGNGKSTSCVVKDTCMGCNANSVDVSEKAFLEIFGDLGVGRGTVTWSFA